MGNELWSGQAQNGVNSDFEVKFDLEGHGQLPPKTIGTLTKVFCIFGPNLAILAWTGPELSRGQASDWHTDRQTDRHTHTDAGNDNTRRPKLASGKNDSHQIYQHEYEFENVNYDVGHTYVINWKWNNWYHFHFHFDYHLIYFQLKKIQLKSLKYPSVVCMPNDMYFIQWITNIIKMAMNYIEIILCASKLHVFNLIFCPDSTDVAKYNYVMMNTL